MKYGRRVQFVFENSETFFVDVPEWPDPKGKPSRIFFKAMTLGEYYTLQKKTGGDADLLVIEVILLKSLDEHGNRIFTLEDKQKLMRATSLAVLLRIAGKITEESGF